MFFSPATVWTIVFLACRNVNDFVNSSDVLNFASEAVVFASKVQLIA